MRFSTTLAIILPLIACSTIINKAAADRPIDDNIACVEFNVDYEQKKDPNYMKHWQSNGELKAGVAPRDGSKNWLENKRIDRKKGRWQWDRFWYTFNVEIGKLKNSDLYVEVVRSSGKGEGQQFVVNFLDKDINLLKAYWIMPNQRCNTKSTFDASQVYKVTLDSVLP